MKPSIPLTGTTTFASISSPEHQRFLKSLNRAMEKTLASGKIKFLNDGAFVRRERGSTGPISKQAAATIEESRQELNSISAPAEPIPLQVAKAPEPRRGPPPRPAFKRPSALK